MKSRRLVPSFILLMVIGAVAAGPVGAGSASLPDSWAGLIALEWNSGIPDDSPLHQQVERVEMKYHKEWLLRVDFRVIDRGPAKVRYRCALASVNYLQTSKTEGKNGAVTTTEDWTIKAEDRALDGHHCNLELVIDPETKEYWIEVGGFEIPDATKTGTIVMSISGGSGTRSVTEPIDKETNVIEPIRFEGRFSDPWPKVLTGVFDANVEPPAGIDITHATLGGTIAWQLYRGWKPGEEIPWLEDCAGFVNACSGFVPDFDDGRCRQDDLCFCLFVSTVTDANQASGGSRLVTVADCLELYCPWEPGTPEFDKALEMALEIVELSRFQPAAVF